MVNSIHFQTPFIPTTSYGCCRRGPRAPRRRACGRYFGIFGIFATTYFEY